MLLIAVNNNPSNVLTFVRLVVTCHMTEYALENLGNIRTTTIFPNFNTSLPFRRM